MQKKYDVIIIGAGPAGLSAAIYSARSGANTLIIENQMLGGQASLAYNVQNFPGFASISGMDLSMKMHQQIENLGVETCYDEVNQINLKEKWLQTSNEKLFAKSIILAMGAGAKKLNIENEERLTGAGVAYCAVCDGAFYKDADVVIVGGGNSAVGEAIYLNAIAKSITIVNNLDTFTCVKAVEDELLKIMENNNKIKIYHSHTVKSIIGDNSVEKVVILNTKNNKEKQISCTGLFVSIGRKADTEIVKGQIALDEHNYIIADENMHTSVDGVFVAGDIRVKNLRQIITACADGAIAGTEASNYANHN